MGNEYFCAAGTMFRVSAHAIPNFHQLLGYCNLSEGKRIQMIPRRTVTIQSNDFKFANFGRMMSFPLRARIPSLIPTSLKPQVVE